MHVSDGLHAQLLEVARQRSRQRMGAANPLVEDVADGVMQRFVVEDGELPGEALEVRVQRMVDLAVASHFRRQTTRLRGNGSGGASDVEALRLFVLGDLNDAGHGPEVWQALNARLDERQRALVRQMAEGVSQRRIAEELGYANAAVVKVTVNRLRVRLRAYLDGQVGR